MPFGVRKFFRLLPVGVFTLSIWCFVTILSVTAAGHFRGDDAVAALTLVSPILRLTTFALALISTGAAVLFSIEMGRLKVARAHEWFSLGVWTTLGFGVIGAILVALFAQPYLRFCGATGDVAAEAASYLAWFVPAPLCGGVMLLLQTMLNAEGDVRRCNLSFTAFFVVFSIVLFSSMAFGAGLGAVSAAIVAGEIAASLVLAGHFFAKTNSLKLVRFFHLKDLREMLSCSLGDASAFLCAALLEMFLTKFTISSFGFEKLIPLQAVFIIFSFSDILDGFGMAGQPLFTVYHGEGNLPGLRRVFNAAIISSLALSLSIFLVFELFPGLIVRMQGVSDGAIASDVVRVVRLTAPVMFFVTFVDIFNTYYMCVEKTILAVLVSVSSYLVFPVFSMALGAQFGWSVYCAAFPLGVSAGLVFFVIFFIGTRSAAEFPYLFTVRRERRVVSFTLRLTEDAVVEVSRKIGDILRHRPALAMRLSLLVEEALLIVRDRNPGRVILAEVTLDRSNGVVLTLRDDGIIFDLTDTDARISSLRGFVVASLMERHSHRFNLITTGFNRNVFKAEIDKI